MQPGVVPAPSKEGNFSDQDRTCRFKAIKVFRITAIMQPGAGPPLKKVTLVTRIVDIDFKLSKLEIRFLDPFCKNR